MEAADVLPTFGTAVAPRVAIPGALSESNSLPFSIWVREFASSSAQEQRTLVLNSLIGPVCLAF